MQFIFILIFFMVLFIEPFALENGQRVGIGFSLIFFFLLFQVALFAAYVMILKDKFKPRPPAPVFLNQINK